MTSSSELIVHLIPIDEITVLNPRLRGKKKFAQIVHSIEKLGLKRPVTVAPTPDGIAKTKYVLVCGQGRLEGYRAKGQETIPAIVVEGRSTSDLMMMSLIENLARRQRTAIELFQEIDVLKKAGYNFNEIAKKTDLDVTYVRGIVLLLSKGEARLLQAVEKGQIPIGIAITIARSDDQAIQRALAEAYESRDLRGRALLKARRLIEKRKARGKAFGGARAGADGEQISGARLLKTYHEETQRQRSFIQRARLCEAQLLFATTAIKQLLADDNFMNLLRAESLDTIPQFLAV